MVSCPDGLAPNSLFECGEYSYSNGYYTDCVENSECLIIIINNYRYTFIVVLCMQIFVFLLPSALVFLVAAFAQVLPFSTLCFSSYV